MKHMLCSVLWQETDLKKHKVECFLRKLQQDMPEEYIALRDHFVATKISKRFNAGDGEEAVNII